VSQLRKRRLGKTNLQVTELSLGGLFVADKYTENRNEAVALIHLALEKGINYFDTAPLYGNSQEVFGQALKGCAGDYILGTKCGRWDYKTGPYFDLDAYKQQLDDSLSKLGRDNVDILYIHESDWAVYWKDMPTPRTQREILLDESYNYTDAPVTQFLRWSKEQGIIKHLGISGNNAHLLARVLKDIDLEVEVILVAFQYSLIWRNARKYLLDVAKDLDIGVVLGAPLQQGRLAVPHPEYFKDQPSWMDDDTRQRFAKLYEIQKETGLSLAEMACRFILADPDFSTVIPGAGNVGQLQENINSALAGPLHYDLHDRLDKLGKVFKGLFDKDY
jgi:aryl-alcohol dehydrogenase-like predicted oxidoreductase